MAFHNHLKLLFLTFSVLLVSLTMAQYDYSVDDDDSPTSQPERSSPPEPVEADASPSPQPELSSPPVPVEGNTSPSPQPKLSSPPVPVEADASPSPQPELSSPPVPAEADASPSPRAQLFAPGPLPSSSSSVASPPKPTEEESSQSPPPSGDNSTLSPSPSPSPPTSEPPSTAQPPSDGTVYPGTDFAPFNLDFSTLDTSVQLSPKIKEICDSTDHPLLCQSTISPSLKGNDADVSSVLKVAIDVTTKLADAGFSFAKRVADKEDNPPELASVLKDCRDSYDSVVYNFENAKSAFPERDMGTMNSMLSAVITNVGDCEDFFAQAGMDSPFSGLADKLTNMTSNCLAIISLMS